MSGFRHIFNAFQNKNKNKMKKKKLDPILETDKETSNSPAHSILRHRALNEGL
jgi:hypothetical protein